MYKSATQSPRTKTAKEAVTWPQQFDLFGLPVSATTCDQAARAVVAAAQQGVSAAVTCHSVHALITACGEPSLGVQTFEMITPDGQPLRWALNLLYGTRLREPVTGRAVTQAVCALAAETGVSVYLYGSTPEVIAALEENLHRDFPDLRIAGAESPPFRALSTTEDDALVERINESGAGIVFVGLGTPKQDSFAFEHRGRVRAVLVCVGAVFDFYAGNKGVAPEWMQRRGLEWVYRLCQEPRRLWRRYLTTNSIFLTKLARAWVFGTSSQNACKPKEAST